MGTRDEDDDENYFDLDDLFNQITAAMERTPVVERLDYVRRLLENYNHYDGDEPPHSPVVDLTLKILDDVRTVIFEHPVASKVKDGKMEIGIDHFRGEVARATRPTFKRIPGGPKPDPNDLA